MNDCLVDLAQTQRLHRILLTFGSINCTSDLCDLNLSHLRLSFGKLLSGALPVKQFFHGDTPLAGNIHGAPELGQRIDGSFDDVVRIRRPR